MNPTRRPHECGNGACTCSDRVGKGHIVLKNVYRYKNYNACKQLLSHSGKKRIMRDAGRETAKSRRKSSVNRQVVLCYIFGEVGESALENVRCPVLGIP